MGIIQLSESLKINQNLTHIDLSSKNKKNIYKFFCNFFFFSKDIQLNGKNIKYFAEMLLINNSLEKLELVCKF